LSGGIYHDFDTTSALIVDALRGLNLDTVVYADPEAAMAALSASPRCGLLTINALRFTMGQHEKYSALRAEWAFELSSLGRAALEQYVQSGGALLGVHTASICFDGWDDWSRILGATWRWGRSFHAPAGEVDVVSVAAPDSTAADLAPFRVVDEVYRDLEVSREAQPWLRARMHGDEDFHPVLWSHRYGAGRVVYDALGHGPESLSHPTHREILRRAAGWLIEAPRIPAMPLHA
jgi:type 1 glutamine amidotransferase